MKKLTILTALMLCVVFVFAACNANTNDTALDENDIQTDMTENETPETDPEEDTPQTPAVTPMVVNVGSLKGPTSIGLVKLMEDASTDTASAYIYDFAVEGAADAVAPRLIKGELDIAAIPANLAATLYNNTKGQIVAIDINTLGVLYIVENGETVSSVEDLRGKTIYSAGKGNTPEYALNYMLSAYGLVPGTDVFVEFKTEHAECVSAILAEENAVAMLPQPFVTTAQMANPSIRTALNLNTEWEVASGKTLVTGVTVARKAFVEENPDAVADFLAKHKASAEYVNANVEEAAALVEKFGIFKAQVAGKAIPACSISYIDGDEMKTALSAYLETLNAQNPAAIGGKMPGDDFYFSIISAQADEMDENA